jgi:hypothetical protein
MIKDDGLREIFKNVTPELNFNGKLLLGSIIDAKNKYSPA